MKILHTLNKPPSHPALVAQLLHTCTPADAILLIEDGCYHALAPEQLLKATPQVYLLDDDARARGLADAGGDSLQRVNYAGFVALCTEYDKVLSWY